MPVRSIAILLMLSIFRNCAVAVGEPLPGTKLLEIQQPLDVLMVEGIDRFALREIEASVDRRAAFWNRDFSNRENYEKSVAPNRERLRTIIGAVDPRVAARGIELIATNLHKGPVGRGKTYDVLGVRWPVLEGVTAEGLLLEPDEPPVARVVVLPDADWTPEQIVGLQHGVAAESQFARRLAENGCQVLVPTLISRDDTFSGHPDVRYTNQPHREFIYRQAFEMGRHVIGYEVQKVMAAVDQFAFFNQREGVKVPIGVAGVGEGGLLALYGAALDTRVEAALVRGYFGPREHIWQEPIYRNIWGLLTEFGDAELASLVFPRSLVIDKGDAPEIAGPPPVRDGRSGGAAPGRIVTPATGDVLREAERAERLLARWTTSNDRPHKFVVVGGEKQAEPAVSQSGLALVAFLSRMGIEEYDTAPESEAPKVIHETSDSQACQKRQFDELVDFTQKLLHRSAHVRDQVWSRADRSSVEKWVESSRPYRDMVYDELIGRLPAPTLEPNVRTRQIIDEPEFVGYEVLLDVYPDVIAGGILLLPRNLPAGEKRPVVVCQHGLEGTPMGTISRPTSDVRPNSRFAADLTRRGFIVYAPQNPYRGQDRFRTLQRKSNPLKRSLFSYIIPQHQRTIEFLKTLSNVDPQRIAFYGISYGGKTALRVPPLIDDYCLSICSADFNEWVRKTASVSDKYSYLFFGEYEIFEWNMAHVANYAELASLMTPRPFMVERGHLDGVAPDEWVAWEYAKVRRHYDLLGLGDRTAIEFFNGGHKINGIGTYDFLQRHLFHQARSEP